MNKRWTGLASAALIAGLLAGCGGGSESGSGSPEASGAQGAESPSQAAGEIQEVRVFHFMVDIAEPFNAMTAEFEKEHPDIKIVNDIVGGSADWKSDLKTRFAAGQGPDIFAVDGPSMLSLWQSRIVDLSGEPWAEHALPFAKEAATLDGKLFGMPYNLQGFGLVYNKDLFEKAGITELPKTLSELEAAAEKLQAAGITPFGNGYGEWWILGMQQINIAFAQQDDPDQFLQDLTTGTAAMKGNPIFEDYKKFLDLTLKYGYANPLTTDYKTQETLLANGEVAMIHQGDWAEMPLRQMNPDLGNIGLMPVPINDDGERMDRLEVGTPMFWAVNKDSKAIEAAKTFMDWMVSSETGKKYLAKDFQFIPAYDNIPADGLSSLSQEVVKYSQAGKTVPWSFNQWPDGTYNEFYALVQGYVANKLDYDLVLEKMDEAWKNLSQK